MLALLFVGGRNAKPAGVPTRRVSMILTRCYGLLRWDMNLRAATILGLVGGGGLGQVLYNDVQLADYGKVSTLIATVMVLVIGSGWLSQPSARIEVRTALPVRSVNLGTGGCHN
jgi:hypothetical protein